jgi:hypothetical protein
MDRGHYPTLREAVYLNQASLGLSGLAIGGRPRMMPGSEIRRPGAEPDLYLFDPKYKLQPVMTGEGEEELFPGGPRKVDIDKMHAYRAGRR